MAKEEIMAALDRAREEITLCADLSDFQRATALRGIETALNALRNNQEQKTAQKEQTPKFPSLKADGGLAFRAPEA
jgi:hypothetical protein